MGKGGFKAIADVFTGGAVSALLPDEENKPKSAGALEAEAAKEAERKRLARAGAMATKGQTMFTTPTLPGGAGQPLKTQLGQ
mgnify:CR=1 FL=1